MIIQSIKKILKVKQNLGSEWLSSEVDNEMKRKKTSSTLKEKFRRLAIPNTKAIKLISCFFIISIVISWISCVLDPVIFCIEQDKLLNIYNTMWQVQTGIAAVSLPILLFIIELSKDIKQAATQSHEVMIRKTWIFPIIIYSLAGSFRIGIDIAWFSKEIVFLIDLIMVFLFTILFAVFSYYQALILLFNPSKMKKSGMKIVKEKMQESLDATIEIRLANNILFEKLEKLKIEFWPFTQDRRENEMYLILKAPRIGILTDIHFGRLEEFINNLPWKETIKSTMREADSGVDRPTQVKIEKQVYVWLMKKYGDIISNKYNGLIRLKKDKFENLDSNELENKLKSIVKIEALYEE